MRRLGLLLLLASAAAAVDREAELAVVGAMRDYYALLGPGGGSSTIESVRDRIVANIKNCRKKTQASVRRQLNKGFESKYEQDTSFHKCLADMLAASGRAGIAMVEKRFRGSSKRDDLRQVLAESLGECGDPDALAALLNFMHDRTPTVAVAAVRGCAAYAGVDGEERKRTMRKLIDRYKEVTDQAAGKEDGSREMKMYRHMRAALNTTLKAFSRGEELDSALAWDAWYRENATKPWPD